MKKHSQYKVKFSNNSHIKSKDYHDNLACNSKYGSNKFIFHVIKSNYHMEVAFMQEKKNRLLDEMEKKKIFKKVSYDTRIKYGNLINRK